MAKDEKRQKTKRAILIVLILLLIAYLVGFTYSRYSSIGKIDGKAEIAKWAVAMTADNGGTTLDSTTKEITFEVESNTEVVPGKIAPDTTATAEIELDLTGTEVAVDFSAVIGDIAPEGLPSADKITLTSKIDGGPMEATNYIPLVGQSAFTSENGKKIVTLTLTWENDDTNNANDTETGERVDGSRTLTIPVTLKVEQHIK